MNSSPRLTFVCCVTVVKSLNLSEFGSHLPTPMGRGCGEELMEVCCGPSLSSPGGEGS